MRDTATRWWRGCVLCALQAAALLQPSAAWAQSAHRICPPIGLFELERGDGLVKPLSTQSMATLDRLHTRYLLEYRTGIAAEAKLALQDMPSGGANPNDMERRLRAFDRTLDRIAECDNRFFDSIQAALPEADWATVAALRQARERSRLLDGYTSSIAKQYGSGVGFVDGVDWVLTYQAKLQSFEGRRTELSDEQRVQFDAWVARNAPKLRQQAQELHDEARKVLARRQEAWQETRVAVENAAASEAVDSEKSAVVDADNRRLYEAWRATEAGLVVRTRELIERNYYANKAMLQELEAILGKRDCDRLRVNFLAELDVHSAWMNKPLSVLLWSVRADSKVDQSLLSGSMEGFAASRAEAMEELAEIALSQASFDVAQSDRRREVRARAASLRAELVRADSEQLDRIRQVLGERATEYLEQSQRPLGDAQSPTNEARWMVKRALVDRARDAESDDGDRFQDRLGPIPQTEVERITRQVGGSDFVGVVADVYGAWRDSDWKAQVTQLEAEIEQLADRAWGTVSASAEPASESEQRSLQARLTARQLARMELVFESEDRLVHLLEETLGPAVSGELRALIQLHCMRRLGPVLQYGFENSELLAVCPPLPHVFEAAGATTEEIRAVLSHSGWMQAAADARALFKEHFQAEQRWDDDSVDSDEAEAQQAAVDQKIAEFKRRYLSECSSAVESAIADPIRRGVFLQAIMRSILPALYVDVVRCERRMVAASMSDELDAAQREQILALQAEYAEIQADFYQELSQFWSRQDFTSNPILDDEPETNWSADELSDLRYLQREYAYKISRSLARALGPELSARFR